ncbi:MAG: hypothetical protein GX815_07115 [Clostridiales bacterium]|nr:hypothetical protein [Clostridiales bacterium]
MRITEMGLNLTTIVFYTNIVLAFVVIFLSRKNPSTTWAWVLVLMFIPVLGFVLYLFLGQDTRRINIFSQKERQDDKKRKTLFQNLLLEEHSDLQHPAIETAKDLMRLHFHNANSIFTQDNQIQVLKNGEEKFPALIKAL